MPKVEPVVFVFGQTDPIIMRQLVLPGESHNDAGRLVERTNHSPSAAVPRFYGRNLLAPRGVRARLPFGRRKWKRLERNNGQTAKGHTQQFFAHCFNIRCRRNNRFIL